uniref:Uncharacterized protein n=1 Tax=Octactis speculum TaxID=3111310 RepID=A0A7S2CTF8_9STRA|mmetsp:Transcript_39690/g.53984  ORF Transcript_39690/g.53984 Transcript_39690/m.53984 type:complete len:364 (+) Transcript_39690:673-1764(+)
MQQLTASEVEMCKQAVARSSSRLEQSSHPSPQKHAALKKEVRIASKAPRLGGIIAVGTAVTSKGTRMSDVTQSPFFTILLPSFLETFSPNTISHDGSSRFRYRFYVGCDAGDKLYDSEAARKKFSELFVRRVGHHRTNGFDDGVSKDDSEDLIGLRLMSLEGTSGAPSWAVAALMKRAYDDGADWLFQLNDDARLLTLGWELRLTGALASNQVTRLLGVTGPTDLTNPRIFTHVFVHRTHLEIHGSFFPPAFRNYYSDDWISAVYGTSSTFRLPDVKMKHETKKQKTGKIERYKPDMSARKALGKQVEDGTKRVLRWLRVRGQDPLRFPLDSVCGFVPLAGYSYVISRSSNESLPSENDGGVR